MWTALKYRAKENKGLYSTHRVTQLKFKGWDKWRVHGAARRAKISLDILGVDSTGPVPMPRDRSMFAFLKNPFKWKKHQELWETRTHSRIITIQADVATTRKVLDYIYRTKYEGVGLRIRRLTFEPLEKYWKNPYNHTDLMSVAEINREEQIKKIRKSKATHANWEGHRLLKRPAPIPYTLRLHYIKADGEHINLTRVVNNQVPFDAKEAEVLDQDIVYDDNMPFPPPKRFSKYDEQIEQQVTAFLQSLRAKAEAE